MKKILSLILICSMCLCLFSCMPNLKKYAIRFADGEVSLTDADAKDPEYVAFIGKLSKFAARLSASVWSDRGNGTNFCISPIAVYMELALACECSDGETRDELLSAVGVTYEEVERFTSYLYSFTNRTFTYTDDSDRIQKAATGKLSSSLWLNTSLLYSPSRVERLASLYNSDVYAASFSSGDAGKMINQYIEYKTSGTTAGDLKISKDTSIAMISTFYLSEVWNSIGKSLTQSLETYDFLETDGNKVKLQMLRSGYSDGRVVETESFSSFFIETEHGYRLHFIVPKDDHQLKNVFTADVISYVLSVKDHGHIDSSARQLHHTRVIFPAFQASFSGDLSGVLKDTFGIKSLFDSEGCDLSGITQQDAYLSSLLHAAAIKIDRSGIDGNPVTLPTTPSTPSLPDYDEYEDIYHELTVDRAFGFVLTDAYGAVLYSGVMSNFE